MTPLQTRIPQTRPISDDQVENASGGFVFGIDDWNRLNRFLTTGSAGGTYVASAKTVLTENAAVITRCLRADGPRTVAIIRDISMSGRAAKQDAGVYALAMAASATDTSGEPDVATRTCALDALGDVCRTGTTLFLFASYVDGMRGWGRGLRRAVAAWYEGDPTRLALQMVKYRQRHDWSHRDLLRKSHASAETVEHEMLYTWAASGGKRPWHDLVWDQTPDALRLVEGFELAQVADSAADTASLVADYGLPREALKTDHLTDPAVWAALAPKMPMTATIRNLATMTRIGLLTDDAAETALIVDRLRDGEWLRRARVHPITILAALMTYQAGRSARSDATWTPVDAIVDALDDAFYAAFDALEPTDKKVMYALDVSGSMTWTNLMDVPGLTPRAAAAAMVMCQMRAGDPYEIVGFTSKRRYGGGQVHPGLSTLNISPEQSLGKVLETVNGLYPGGTDCSLPIRYAIESNIDVDAIVVATDNETYGQEHCSEALAELRQKLDKPVKMIVMATTASEFSIADPDDPHSLDVAGFDSATPSLIQAFIEGGF